MDDVTIVPYTTQYRAATLELLPRWSPDHPELGSAARFDWQRCNRFLALREDTVVGHIAQLAHEFRYADGRPPVRLGWGITLVLDMSDDATRKAAGRGLLKACEVTPGLPYAAVGVVPTIEPAYLRRGHQIQRDGSAYYARFFAPRRILAYWKKPAAFAPLLALANLAVPAPTRLRHGRLERITEFRADWDATWDALLRARYDCYGKRDADFLNYKLAQPEREYHAFVHYDAAGQLDGYVVYRRARHRTRDLDLVKICDFVGSSGAVPDLLAEAMRFARMEARGTYGIVGLSSVADAAAFRAAGMYVRRPYPVVLAAGVAGKVRVDFFDSDLDDLW